MENLDDLMRKKFDADDPAARFEFQDEFWEQAQALIEADERKRRRRRFVIWWWSAGLLLLVAGVWYCHSLYRPDGRKGYTLHMPTPNSEPGETAATAAYGTHEKHAAPTADTNAARNTETGETNTIAARNSERDETNTTAARNTETGETNTIAARNSERGETNTTAARNSEKDETNTTAARNSETGKTAATSKRAEGGKTATPHSAPSAPIHTGVKDKNTPQPPAPSTPRGGQEPKHGAAAWASAPAAQPSGQPMPAAAPPSTPSAPSPGSATQPAQGSTSAATPPAAPTLPPKPPALSPLPLLPAPLLPLPWPMPLRPQASAPTPTIQPHRPQPWSLSIGGAGSAFFPKNRPAQAGASVRVSLACRLYDRWSVQGGLGWRTLPAGAFAADTGGYALRSSQLRYAFGYERTSTELSPTALHVLDLPLALRWHPLRQVWAEGGLSLSRLMGVRGQWTQHTSTSLQPDGAHSTRHVWVPERGYRKLWLSPSIGAGWQHGRWSAGLRALGVPADLMPPLVPDAPPRKGWLLNWEIGLNWRIF